MQEKIADEGSIDVLALIELLWRYRLVVIGCTLLGAGLAIWMALTARYLYEAEVVVTPVVEEANGLGSLAGRFGGLASLAGISLPASGGNAVEAQAILQSRYLAETFIAGNKLEAEIVGGPNASLWKAVDRFRRTVLKVTLQKDKGTTTVTIRWKDPAKAAQWANQYVALANDILRNRALEASNRNIKFLNEKLSTTSVLEVQRVMYSLIENEAKNHMLASTRTDYAFTIVDPAVTPEDRVWPRRSLMVATGTVLGFAIGAFLALAYNLWRRFAARRPA